MDFIFGNELFALNNNVMWNHLPAELICFIFKHLPVKDVLLSARKVCKNWNDVVYQTAFWLWRMQRAGIRINQELKASLIFSAEDPETVLRIIQAACLFKENPNTLPGQLGYGQVWTVRESGELNIFSASAILLFRTPKRVNLVLKKDPNDVKYLSILLKILALKDCEVELEDRYSWRNPNSKSDKMLEVLTAPSSICRLKNFQGSLSSDTISHIPNTVFRLDLSIKDPQVLQDLMRVKPPGLENLWLHMEAGSLDTSNLVQIQNVRGCGFYVSNLKDGDEAWLASVAQKIMPNEGFYGLFLVSCNFSVNVMQSAIQLLSDMGIKTWQVCLSSPNFTEENAKDLKHQLQHHLRSYYIQYKLAENLELYGW
ncbi:unnamed protein product [Meganyctiphanes norvegica]|uniref:F-box domain-containing protein n=1 Tax=Meganyctiphanes norvegica TaxID=48144 RepID=A0AAV2PHT3_MEGNR